MRYRFLVAIAASVFALLTVRTPLVFSQAQGEQVQPAQGQPAPGQRGQGAGQRGRGAQPPAPSKPTPRWADGKPRLGAPPGEKGIWGACCGNLSNAKTPFQPWAKALFEDRRRNELEPHTRCKPSGGARQFVTPYGTEIVEIPELQRIFVMDIGGPHTYRTIFMDGRPHPTDLIPTYYGHSIGHWEGDTLVVDTVGFNEGFWMDRAGSPHTEKLHFMERFTRTDFNTMRYEVTVDDPGAYTATWSAGPFSLRWNAGEELFEYVCQANNFAHGLMLGAQESVDRSSPIIP